MFHVAECASLPEFEALRPEWDQLIARSEASIFSDWAWVEAAWRYAFPGKQPRVLLVREAAGTLVGALPLARTTRLPLFATLEVIGSAPDGYPLADYGGLIAERGKENAVWGALLGFLARRRSWSLMDLRNCPAGRPSADHYRQAAARLGWRVEVSVADVCRRLTLGPTFDAYLATLSGNSRGQIRRKLRKLADDGHTVVAVDVHDAAARNAALETLFTYHQARWADDPSGGAFPTEASRAMHRRLAGHLAARGTLDLRQVRGADGTCAGVIYNFRQGGVTYFYQIGLNGDEAWRAYSLGVCLLADSIAAACVAGDQTFDLLRGDHDYKRHFGGDLRENLRVTMYRYRWLPALAETARALRRRLRPAPAV